MRTRSDNVDLAAELRALRATPRPDFAAELDRRAAAGFPRPERGGRRSNLARLRGRLRLPAPRRAAIAGGALALLALVATTAVIALGEGEPQGTPTPGGGGGGSLLNLASPDDPNAAVLIGPAPLTESSGAALGRAIKRDAQLTLRSTPEQIGADARQVFAIARSFGGLVLSSSIEDNVESAYARFQLSVPAHRLDEAVEQLSGVAEVTSRRQAGRDVTAPTISAAERLRDAEARISGLLGRLAGPTSEAERLQARRELRLARLQATSLRNQLRFLRKRARSARIQVLIQTGADSAGWGPSEAIADAGRLLGIAAAVTIVALAVLAPFALLALLAWLARRAWVRRRRREALRQT